MKHRALGLHFGAGARLLLGGCVSGDDAQAVIPMKEWLQIALEGHVVRRGLAYAVVVGSILIGINHGNAIAAGEVDRTRALQMVLTVFVPYTVSTLSSVGAIRTAREAEARR